MSALTKAVAPVVLDDERARLWVSILEQSAEGIMICDPQLRILLVNPAFERITGYSSRQAVGKTPNILHSGRQSPEFYVQMWRSIVTAGQWSGEIWNRRRNGELYVEWLTIHGVCNEQGVLTHYVGVFSDVTRRKETEARLKHATEFDELTQLPNRGQLLSRLRELIQIAARTNGSIAVLFIDLDRFNNVNDSMGHEAGDTLLKVVSQRLLEAVRTSDVVARMSADEFVVLVPQLRDASDAAAVAQKVLDAIHVPVGIRDQELVITASAGICIYPQDGSNEETLLRNAAAAMNRAKRSGRNTFEFYRRAMNERSAGQLQLENELRQALDRNELELYYQPQVDLATGAIVGAEALVRWNRPGVDIVQPSEFIPLAQERGLIVPLGRWVMREVARQLAAWNAMGLNHFAVAINVTADEFHQKGFVEELTRVIGAHALDPSRLELELTESIAVQDVEGTARILQFLHRLGVRLSLDDFGTGYSSLSYLRRFPIDRIKIDQSFIRELDADPEAIRVVRAIIGLARSFDMKVIAEGVETQAQLRALRAEHCDEVQGFLASPALPALDFERLLRQGPQPFAAVANAET